LDREKHLAYLRKGFLAGFPSSYVSLDASRPWLVYWALHSFDLLGYELSQEERERTVETIKLFQNGIEGGFCGGDHEFTGNLSHLAPTYASILSIAILAVPEAYNLINRTTLKSFLHRLKQSDGSFRMHAIDGEIDVRAVYCAVVVGKLTGSWDDELENGVVAWIAKCQSWEGGFAGVPGAEAHGGYTFCAIAALKLLLLDNNDDYNIMMNVLGSKINLNSLLYWLTSQQVQPIGGFRGRTHKLVDGCYSFWQAACFDCIGKGNLIDSAALQRYVLAACQDEQKGGLRDKPGK
jgi:protein farnesyltransferase subunit beta